MKSNRKPSRSRTKPPKENPEFTGKELLTILDGVAKELVIPDYLAKVVYFLFNKGELVYVGQSAKYGVFQRYVSHKKDKEFDRILVVPLDSEDKQFDIEAAFINITGGKYNCYRSGQKSRIEESKKLALSILRKSIKNPIN